jgi:hypothetical protein
MIPLIEGAKVVSHSSNVVHISHGVASNVAAEGFEKTLIVVAFATDVKLFRPAT